MQYRRGHGKLGVRGSQESQFATGVTFLCVLLPVSGGLVFDLENGFT